MSILQMPADLNTEDILFTEKLEPVPPRDIGVLLGETPEESPPDLSEIAVSIGRPQSWPLIDYYIESRQKIPPDIKLQLKEADFCLVRLACSFHYHPGVELIWARFTTKLNLDDGTEEPIAFYMYPSEIIEEETFPPQITAEHIFGFQTRETVSAFPEIPIPASALRPVVIAAGMQESQPSWTFSPTEKYPIIGYRNMILIVKKPRLASKLSATFEIVAEAAKIGKLSWLFRNKQDHKAKLTASLCQNVIWDPDVTIEGRTRAQLYWAINQVFNLDELRTLCFHLNIDYENIPGETKESKVRELILYCERHARVPDLVNYGHQKRPDLFA